MRLKKPLNTIRQFLAFDPAELEDDTSPVQPLADAAREMKNLVASINLIRKPQSWMMFLDRAKCVSDLYFEDVISKRLAKELVCYIGHEAARAGQT